MQQMAYSAVDEKSAEIKRPRKLFVCSEGGPTRSML